MEIKNNISKKITVDNSITEYNNSQQNLLTELFRKILKNIIPIEFKIFSNKCIKINEFEKDDTLEEMINKIKENCEM